MTIEEFIVKKLGLAGDRYNIQCAILYLRKLTKKRK